MFNRNAWNTPIDANTALVLDGWRPKGLSYYRDMKRGSLVWDGQFWVLITKNIRVDPTSPNNQPPTAAMVNPIPVMDDMDWSS